jgi:hypothetical protein
MNECIMCKEIITNPICIECIEDGVTSWLQQTRPELVYELREKTNEIIFKIGNTNCIICKTKMAICPYCYKQHLTNWLESYPELLDEFNYFFKF